MIILGIDPGLERVGYGVIGRNSDGTRAHAYGCITTDRRIPTERRLAEIYHKVLALIKKHKPEVVACEKLFFFKNQKTVIQVGQARGVVLLASAHAGVPLVEPTPLQVKSSLTSWGVSPKRNVQMMVKKLFGLAEIPKPDDAADALAIAYSGATLYTNIKFQAPNHKQISMTKNQNDLYRHPKL